MTGRSIARGAKVMVAMACVVSLANLAQASPVTPSSTTVDPIYTSQLLGCFEGVDTQGGGASSEFLTFLTDNGLETDIAFYAKLEGTNSEGPVGEFTFPGGDPIGVAGGQSFTYSGSADLKYFTVKSGTEVCVYEFISGEENFFTSAQATSHMSWWTGRDTPPGVPEPGEWVLLGVGLIGLVVYSQRRKAVTAVA